MFKKKSSSLTLIRIFRSKSSMLIFCEATSSLGLEIGGQIDIPVPPWEFKNGAHKAMPRFSANLSFLFTELEFLDRFKAARNAGFDAVEFMFPYSYEKQQLAEVLKVNNLELVLHNLPAGNWEAGERGTNHRETR